MGEQTLELNQVGRSGVGNGVEFHSRCLPGDPVVALLRACARRGGLFFLAGRRPDEHADEMLSACVNEGRDGAAVHDIEAAALERKTVIGKIPDRRREIEFAVEPGLYSVLVGRKNVGEMTGLERAEMGVDDLSGQHGLVVVSRQAREKPPC